MAKGLKTVPICTTCHEHITDTFYFESDNEPTTTTCIRCHHVHQKETVMICQSFNCKPKDCIDCGHHERQFDICTI